MRYLVGFVFVLALGLSACGDSDSDDGLALKEHCDDYCSVCVGSYLCERNGRVPDESELITFCEFLGTYLTDARTGEPIVCEAELVPYLRCDGASGMCGENPEDCLEEYFVFANCVGFQ